MKKTIFFAVLAVTGLASCSSDLLQEMGITDGDNKAIKFQNTLTNNATRTSLSGATFYDGSAMAVDGFQTTDAVVDKIFNNQKVDYKGATTWEYSPLKYWNDGSTYEFYGFYPYAVAHNFADATKNYTVPSYTVADDIDDQKDLMIAEKNTTVPFNKVDMTYDHILSNVHFFAKVSADVIGWKTVTINSLNITGLKNTGTFTQDGFVSTRVNGAWNELKGEYTFPTITPTGVKTTITAGGMGTDGNIVRDLLMMPQPLNATLSVNYTIAYEDGSSTTFRKAIPLESIINSLTSDAIDQWDINTVYNYTMTLNPTKRDAKDYNPDCIDWDGSLNDDCEPTPGYKLVGPDANGNYTVTDGVHTYPVVWEDLDGDGMLEGGVDRDGDGKIDDVDGENVNNADATALGKDQVSDGNANNPNGRDVILVDNDGDNKPDTQLERKPDTTIQPENPTDDEDPTDPTQTVFTIDWNGSQNAQGGTSTDPADETKPVEYSRLVQDADGEYYVEVDVDKDGSYDGASDTRTKVLWEDIDGDGNLEGYIGDIDGDNTNNGSSTLTTDGNSNNPNGYDVILIDTDKDGVCDTQLEKVYSGEVTPSKEVTTVIEFTGTITDWKDTVNSDTVIKQ